MKVKKKKDIISLNKIYYSKVKVTIKMKSVAIS